MQHHEQAPLAEACAAYTELLSAKHAQYLGGREFLVSSKQVGPAVYVSVTLRNSSDTFHYPVEGRILTNQAQLTAKSAQALLMDYIDAYFEEFLRSGEDVYLPIDWADYELEGMHFQLKGQILNLNLERQADAWLSAHEGKH